MQVLDDEEQPVLLGGQAEERQDRLEEPQPAVRRPRLSGSGAILCELGEDLRQLADMHAQPPPRPGRLGARKVVSDRLQERQVGEGQVRFRAGALHDRGTDLLGLRGELAAEPALAHPRVARQDHHRTFSTAGGQQGVLEGRQLLFSADQDAADRPDDHGAANLTGGRRAGSPACRWPIHPASAARPPAPAARGSSGWSGSPPGWRGSRPRGGASG